MHSLNPFLRAFFKSALPSQCNPVNNHVSIRFPSKVLAAHLVKNPDLTSSQILLVPTTECLLTGKDGETGSTYSDLAVSEDLLASHVLRISGTPAPGSGKVRDHKGKAKQFNTINGKTIVVKESFVYSNKGRSIAATK